MSSDTDPKTATVYREMLMRRTPEERFMMGLQMCELARATVLASLPPDLSPVDRKIAILRRYYQNDFSAEELSRIEQSIRNHAETKSPS
jgi:hypothetical protein